MNIFISKNENAVHNNIDIDSIIFSLNRYDKRNVYTNFPDTINRMVIKDIYSIY